VPTRSAACTNRHATSSRARATPRENLDRGGRVARQRTREAGQIRGRSSVVLAGRPLYERLVKAAPPCAAQLRRSSRTLKSPKPADTAKRREAIDRALDAHRGALADAVRRVLEIAATSGSHPDAYAVSAMLEALSLAPKLPDSPGRFTESPAPTGFAALQSF
jgi:hypothetical protein